MQQLHRLEDLKTYALQAQGDEIGKINEVYFDDEHWLVRYFVVHTGGWLLGRDVLIAPRLITRLSEKSRLISTDLTREQVEESPLVDTEKPVSRHYEAEYYRYYGWKPYWGKRILPGGSALPHTMPHLESIKAPEHPHLRASNEVQGYRIHTSDGELGKVYDFILNDGDWKIQYLVLETSEWLLGKKVLVATAWVVSVDWAEKEITVELDREIIQSAPPYDPSQLIDRDYEVNLFKHYVKAIHAEDNSSSID
jgi:sporulation protein YlmC with PRC-barrel domain